MGLQAVRMDTEGVATVIDLNEGGIETAEGIRLGIGSRWFDCVRLAGNLDMWIDDEGMYAGGGDPRIVELFRRVGLTVPDEWEDAELNLTATMIAKLYGHVWQPYAGNVVFTGGADDEGVTLAIGEIAKDALVKLSADARQGPVGKELSAIFANMREVRAEQQRIVDHFDAKAAARREGGA